MLPPILEIYVVWHPADGEGEGIAKALIEHFHGTAFSGLIGGAVEVFIRSQPWADANGAPRPIPSPTHPLPNQIGQAAHTAIVPLLGIQLAGAVESNAGGWANYIEEIAVIKDRHPDTVGIYPYSIDRRSTDQTRLGQILGRFQQIATPPFDAEGDSAEGQRARDLAQGIAQQLSRDANARITIFLSHTKKSSTNAQEDVSALIAQVRSVIANTRLQEFFDASDLQPGTDWDAVLRAKAATSALLAIRTDLYPTREWCQREMLISKRQGMPVVTMDALGEHEERGSFIMDHIPRVPVRASNNQWDKKGIYRALNLLVDQCLKRALWNHQQELANAHDDLGISWWAPHAPEPLTLIQWMEDSARAGTLPAKDADIRILHPDPPLGPDEHMVLQQIVRLSGSHGRLDVMTPRLFAARGG